jgi:CRP-like cAMP-binding protein
MLSAPRNADELSAEFGVGPRLRPSRLGGLVALPPASWFAAGATICDQGENAYVCEVIEGMARTAQVTGDGRRVVNGFFGPGEVFGFAALGVGACAGEAVCDSVVARCARGSLESRALVDPGAARQLWAWLTQENARTAARLSLLAHGSALEKIAHFLLEMAERLGGKTRVVLPMSRYDIGDYLGLASETVSRTFTVLRERGLVATEGRAVVLLRPEALGRYGVAPN